MSWHSVYPFMPTAFMEVTCGRFWFDGPPTCKYQSMVKSVHIIQGCAESLKQQARSPGCVLLYKVWNVPLSAILCDGGILVLLPLPLNIDFLIWKSLNLPVAKILQPCIHVHCSIVPIVSVGFHAIDHEGFLFAWSWRAVPCLCWPSPLLYEAPSNHYNSAWWVRHNPISMCDYVICDTGYNIRSWGVEGVWEPWAIQSIMYPYYMYVKHCKMWHIKKY